MSCTRPELASTLRWCAEQMEKHDQTLWNEVCNALDKGNRAWCQLTGISYTEMAVNEINRLYAIERLALKALAVPTELPQSESKP